VLSWLKTLFSESKNSDYSDENQASHGSNLVEVDQDHIQDLRGMIGELQDQVQRKDERIDELERRERELIKTLQAERIESNTENDQGSSDTTENDTSSNLDALNDTQARVFELLQRYEYDTYAQAYKKITSDHDLGLSKKYFQNVCSQINQRTNADI